MALESKDWSMLPDHILVHMFSYMRRSDQAKSSLVCKAWNDIFNSPYLWTYFNFWFYMPTQEKSIRCLDKFGKFLKHVYIELDQSVEINRVNACKVLECLASLEERRLKSLKIKFTGENPYFYAGKEFLDALTLLFCKGGSQLTEVDLSGLMVTYDDKLINVLSANNSKLETLKLQNTVLVCKVSPECILRLVQQCRHLQDLRVYNCSISEDILLAFAENDRKSLKHLSIICRREEKYGKDIGSDVWNTLTKKLTNLKVSLSFDHTVPRHRIADIMKPEIPVSVLRLETFSYIYDEINLASDFYAKTLEKFVLQTPLSRNSQELNQSLVRLAEKCKHLMSMHVFCVLDEPTVGKILQLCPRMKENDSFTLKFKDEPVPWSTGYDYFHE